MCTLNDRYLDGVNRSSFSLSRMAFVQRYTYFFRRTSSATRRSMSGYMSGSPPGMLTMGAPHSSTAARHFSTLRFLRRIWAGYWILPQPAQARLQRNRGSSISTNG
jgi:hypothetical protein